MHFHFQCGTTGSQKSSEEVNVPIVAILLAAGRIARLVQTAGMRSATVRTAQRKSRHYIRSCCKSFWKMVLHIFVVGANTCAIFVELAWQTQPRLPLIGTTSGTKISGVDAWIVVILGVQARIARLVQCAGMRLAMDRTVQRISRH